jgi:hypothetical protein
MKFDLFLLVVRVSVAATQLNHGHRLLDGRGFSAGMPTIAAYDTCPQAADTGPTATKHRRSGVAIPFTLRSDVDPADIFSSIGNAHAAEPEITTSSTASCCDLGVLSTTSGASASLIESPAISISIPVAQRFGQTIAFLSHTSLASSSVVVVYGNSTDVSTSINLVTAERTEDGGFESLATGAETSSYVIETSSHSTPNDESSPGLSTSSSAIDGAMKTTSALGPMNSSSNTVNGSSKRGLSYNDATLTQAFAGKGIGWAYNWGVAPDGSIVEGAEYVPMLWGLNSLDDWASAVGSAVASGSKHVLGFNEPDLSTQSDIDPQTAANSHIQHMNPLAGQVSIGSPAVTNGAGTSPSMGIDWLNEFFRACAGQCVLNFIAFHWYSEVGQMDDFKQHVQNVIGNATHNGVDKVWLTEFAATGSDSDVANFITEATAFLDPLDSVERYAYFMCSDGILIQGDGISNPIGQAYV